MFIDNALTSIRVLRFVLSYFATFAICAQTDSSCTTHLIVDTDIFSDVEYVSIVVLPLATNMKGEAI